MQYGHIWIEDKLICNVKHREHTNWRGFNSAFFKAIIYWGSQVFISILTRFSYRIHQKTILNIKKKLDTIFKLLCTGYHLFSFLLFFKTRVIWRTFSARCWPLSSLSHQKVRFTVLLNNKSIEILQQLRYF